MLRKESKEKEMHKCLFMLRLQGELEHINPMSGWGKERPESRVWFGKELGTVWKTLPLAVSIKLTIME